MNKRLAKGSDGIEREWLPSERYRLFSRGFRDGAAVKVMRSECSGLGAYDRGYAAGRRALNEAVAAYANEVGYEPTVLRSTSALPEKP